jgi:hypothetical protein
VARIGDEVDPHVFKPARGGQVAEEQDDPGLPAQRRRLDLEEANLDFEDPLRRHPFDMLDPAGFAARQHLLDAAQHVGAAQREGQRVSSLEVRQQRLCGIVGLDHDAAAVDQDHRVRDMGQHSVGDSRLRAVCAGLTRRRHPAPWLVGNRDGAQGQGENRASQEPPVQKIMCGRHRDETRARQESTPQRHPPGGAIASWRFGLHAVAHRAITARRRRKARNLRV